MRPVVLAPLLIAALASAEVGSAQVYRTESLPPAVTAAGAPWQRSGDPIFYAGTFYFPAGPDRFFDGKVMVRSGVYDGVPLYEDATLQPYSVVYVPIGGAIMRPYQRRTAFTGHLPGPIGGVIPDWDHVDWTTADWGRSGLVSGARYNPTPYVPRRGWRSRRGVGRPSPAAGELPEGTSTVPLADLARSTGAAARAGTAPQPRVSGIWIMWQGARWFNSGPAVDYDPARFERVGDDQGFPVYRMRGGPAGRIYVAVVQDGPLAPFERR
jgi:hypothetical protein